MADKKFKTKVNGKTVSFGAKGYSIALGTAKGKKSVKSAAKKFTRIK